MGDFNPAPYPPPDVVHSAHRPLTQTTAPQRTHHPPPYPPPDINNPAFAPESPNSLSQRANPGPPHFTPPPQAPPPANPPFLIIGLFALRLTQHTLTLLPPYARRATDLAWLTAFLAPWDPAYDLAKISSSTYSDFLATYPRIVSRMKSQDKFPAVFMAMDPTGRKRKGLVEGGGMADAEWKEMVDFVHAAAEWGSVVRVPREEEGRVREVARRRLVADLDAGRGGVGVRARQRDW